MTFKVKSVISEWNELVIFDNFLSIDSFQGCAYFSVSAITPSGPDKSFIINELNQAGNLSMSVPDVGGISSGKQKEPAVLMVEPYSQSSGDDTFGSTNKEKG